MGPDFLPVPSFFLGHRESPVKFLPPKHCRLALLQNTKPEPRRGQSWKGSLCGHWSVEPAIDIQGLHWAIQGLLGPLSPSPLASHSQDNTIPPLRSGENPSPPSAGFSEKSKKLTRYSDGGKHKTLSFSKMGSCFHSHVSFKETLHGLLPREARFSCPPSLELCKPTTELNGAEVARAGRQELNQAQTSAICVQF